MCLRKKPSLNKLNFIISLLLGTFALLLVSCAPSYDVVISGGLVYDGTGSAPYEADIGIKDGIIRTIGNIKTSGNVNIDAEGLFVVPGFIDIHTHCDRGLQMDELKNAKNYLTQGVTTVVTGNCGGGTYRVEEFFSKLDSQGIGPNVIHLVGHGTVRREVMGQEAREPTADELDQMKKLIAQGMEEGAVGFSTGLFYAPGSFAKTEEIVELAFTVKEFNGIYASHIRDESNYTIGLKESIKEAIEVGERAGIPVEISHIKALGKPVWGQSSEVCAIIEEARERGVRVYADQYPYMASSTGLSAAVIPRWVQAGGEMKNRLSDPELLPRIKKEISENIDRRVGPESLVVVSFPKNRDFDGKNLLEISEMMKKPVVETALYLILNGSPSVISFSMAESDLKYFMKKPYVMTGSDGNIQIPGKSFPHPRSYGTFTRKIRKYVIENEWITMEQAIRAATGLPAEVLGLDDRGRLKKRFAADIVVFDPDEVSDKATYENPHQYSVGIRFLFINGEVVIEDGSYNGKLAGIPIRMSRK
ncbi:MAG: D-aminoacylase [Candidatus Aminicenantes bacterium]|nr:MAG: D-aminoacylase [Candidatus Aminicenantes bacterium]